MGEVAALPDVEPARDEMASEPNVEVDEPPAEAAVERTDADAVARELDPVPRPSSGSTDTSAEPAPGGRRRRRRSVVTAEDDGDFVPLVIPPPSRPSSVEWWRSAARAPLVSLAILVLLGAVAATAFVLARDDGGDQGQERTVTAPGGGVLVASATPGTATPGADQRAIATPGASHVVDRNNTSVVPSGQVGASPNASGPVTPAAAPASPMKGSLPAAGSPTSPVRAASPPSPRGSAPVATTASSEEQGSAEPGETAPPVSAATPATTVTTPGASPSPEASTPVPAEAQTRYPDRAASGLLSLVDVARQSTSPTPLAPTPTSVPPGDGTGGAPLPTPAD